ncbi:MAG: pentapeptide repeat-containing protein [Cyanobacteria bacterium P01_F01_bin.150]
MKGIIAIMNRRSVFFASSIKPVRRFWFTLVLTVLVVVGLSGTAATAYDGEHLIGVDFSGQDLTTASFIRTFSRQSNFSNTNLQGVSLNGSHFEDTNFEGADLSYATLDGAYFDGSNLTNAVLEGAFAFGTEFQDSIIDGADFTDVFMRENTQEELCAIAKGTNPTTGNETRDTLFCD